MRPKFFRCRRVPGNIRLGSTWNSRSGARTYTLGRAFALMICNVITFDFLASRTSLYESTTTALICLRSLFPELGLHGKWTM
ncbi:hypothetical protein BDQ94DRAFT_132335, partial [Aspergillus welwitschiae]